MCRTWSAASARPRADTIALLATALDLVPEDSAALADAARRPPSPAIATAGVADPPAKGAEPSAAELAQARGAVRLAGAVSALRAGLGQRSAAATQVPTHDPAGPQDPQAPSRSVLGEAAYERAWAEGTQMPLAQALRLARQVLNSSR